MPTDGLAAAGRMAEAFAVVAAVAVPAGLAAGRLGRRAAFGRLPTAAADDAVAAFGYLVLFAGYQVVTLTLGEVATAAGLPARLGADPAQAGVWRGVFGGLLSAPLVLAGWLVFRTATGNATSWATVLKALGAGVAAWLIVGPVVFGVNALVECVAARAGFEPAEHPLVGVFAAADATRAAVLMLAAAVATPLAEEVVFRGLLLGRLVRRPAAGALPVGLGVLLAGLATAGTAAQRPAVGFAALLAAGWLATRGRPTLAGVWATAALFAAAHSTVWPSPVPLFLLGLALGWVAVRTGGVSAGVVLHGLFNTVSAVYLLRGGS